jgi:multiple sugar transport system substrate-binding protein
MSEETKKKLSRRKFVALTGGALAASGLLAACGDNTATTAPAATTAAAPAATTAAAPAATTAAGAATTAATTAAAPAATTAAATTAAAPAATTAAASSGKVVHLKMWGGVPAESGPQKVVDNWNAKNPDIQVEYVRFVNDDPGNLKLDTALLATQDIDMFMNYATQKLQKRVQGGLVLDLGMFKDLDIEGKVGDLAKPWKIDGKYYTLPTNIAPAYIWVNKAALDEAGLAVPALDWNLDDFKNYALKMKKANRWGYVPWDVTTLYSLIDNSFGYVYTKPDGTSRYDDPLVKKTLQTFHDMMYVDKSIIPWGEQTSAKLAVDATFFKNESAMLGAGTWIFRSSNNLKDYPHTFNSAFATFPKVSADQKDYWQPITLGDALSISSKSKYPQEAYKFMKWYADGGMIPLAVGGRIPASKDINQDDAVTAMLGGNEKMYDLNSVKAVIFNRNPPLKSFDALDKQVADMVKEEVEKYYVTPGGNVDTTIANIVRRHNDFLKAKK